MKEKKKMGRPTNNPKTHRFEIRLSDTEKDMLDECKELSHKSKSDIVVEGISMFYNKLKRGN